MRNDSATIATWHPSTAAEIAAVRVALERVVTSEHFRASKRYPGLLRFVVERTLEGRASELKERTLGVEFFERELTYDTHADPIVRVTAGEVRKRVLHYYAHEGVNNPIQIELQPGSYVPVFVLRGTISHEPEPAAGPASPEPEPVAIEAVAPEKLEPVQIAAAQKPQATQAPRVMVAVLVVLLLLCGLFAWKKSLFAGRPNDAFWDAVLKDDRKVLICTPTLSSLDTGEAKASTTPLPEVGLMDAVTKYSQMSFDDAVAQTKVATYLTRGGKDFQVQSSERATFADLQHGPVVLIGAISNPWTLRLTSRLRFHFSSTPGDSRILDSKATTQPAWNLDGHMALGKLARDYAVVARFHDPTTDQMVIVVAGLGSLGTAVAGDLVTDRERVNALLAGAPAGWKGENLEAVIEAQVINSVTGPPRVVATEYW